MTGFCAECASHFMEGSNLMVLSISWSISLLLLLMLRWKKNQSVRQKLIWMYGHLFALLFPFVWFLFYEGCEQLLSGCRGFLKAGALVLLTAVLSGVGVSLLSPFLFLRNYIQSSRLFPQTHLARFARKKAAHLKLRLPKVYFVDSEKPLAFSWYYRNQAIFVSIGLVSLLTRKEAEAVVLHELYHLKSRSSIYKWSAQLVYLLSPVSKLACFHKELSGEERQADRFAVALQKTSKYLVNAKRKTKLFYRK